MIRRSHSLMMILAIAGCSAPQTHAANTDTVALLRTVVRYASDTLKVGPRIIIARSTKANPDARLSLPTQQALLADSLLSAVERYDLAHQTCDPAAKPPVCHFQTADGMIAVRNVRVWPKEDSGLQRRRCVARSRRRRALEDPPLHGDRRRYEAVSRPRTSSRSLLLRLVDHGENRV